MTTDRTLAEMETHLGMTADNRSEWDTFCDDAVMQRKIERVGILPYKLTPDGTGKFYKIPSNQISFRRPPKPMSAKRKLAAAKRLAEWREQQETDG